MVHQPNEDDENDEYEHQETRAGPSRQAHFDRRPRSRSRSRSPRHYRPYHNNRGHHGGNAYPHYNQAGYHQNQQTQQQLINFFNRNDFPANNTYTAQYQPRNYGFQNEPYRRVDHNYNQRQNNYGCYQCGEDYITTKYF